ncbi:uncharacterized protein LOC133272382 [Pezoporus flaviventris]|nr:uncharacterized protein LOC133272381 [Pezoporus flaviventris]XP_061315526.1 uncharacterized protein LOC133272382 [Pezoporus flaviventris]
MSQGGEHRENLGAAEQEWERDNNDLWCVAALGKGFNEGERGASVLPAPVSVPLTASTTMEAAEVKKSLGVLVEQLEQSCAESRRWKERLQCWAAEADGAAFRLAMQRYSEQAGSKELLQDMDGTHEDLSDAVQEVRSQEEKHLACMGAWLREEQQKDKILDQQIEKLEEAVAQKEERDLLARRRGFCYWLQMLSLLLVSLELAVGICVAAALVCTLRLDLEFFCCVLSCGLPEQIYSNLVYALGWIFPAVTEGLLPC